MEFILEIDFLLAGFVAINLILVVLAGPLAAAFLRIRGTRTESLPPSLGKWAVVPEPAGPPSRTAVVKTLVWTGGINILGTVLIRVFLVPAFH